LISTHAAVVLAPWHGQFVLGKSLPAAVDAAERVDWNARTLLLARLFSGSKSRQEAEQRALERSASAYE
jgi:ribulose-5-phosphate 4-epimerase/fuculose-1-phosphate aldolase